MTDQTHARRPARTRGATSRGLPRGAAASCRPTSTGSSPGSTSPCGWRGPTSSGRCGTRCVEIPYGETASYGEIARRIGRPGAARAVGLANGHNPVAIIVPCHRVIGADGSLTGYGGGLDRKQTLLQLERDHFTPRLALPV